MTQRGKAGAQSSKGLAEELMRGLWRKKGLQIKIGREGELGMCKKECCPCILRVLMGHIRGLMGGMRGCWGTARRLRRCQVRAAYKCRAVLSCSAALAADLLAEI
jgi:hypothetical protein